jgi:predicted small secreted protein
MMNATIKAVLLGTVLMGMTLALGGCGNTVKGIGTDIVGMGEDLMKEDVKNEEK